jgi:threonyl-tRNA synthetase
LASNGQINITFPDGSKKQFPKGITSYDIAKSISNGLAEEALVSKVNGVLIDMVRPLENDAEVKFFKFSDDEGKKVYWHSTSHILAQAVEELFPGAKFGVGPAIDNGFYYDIDCGTKFTEDDLKRIEDRMLEIAKRDLKTQREEMKREDAIKFFKSKRPDPYKVEILEDIAKGEKIVSVYHQGNFTDLCRGPHMPTTAKLKFVKLLGVSGSYWRGDSNRQQLQRIYGISFPQKKQLEEYLKLLEEAKNRDHRKLGKELELFFFHEVSPGAPFWLPNGMFIFRQLEKLLRIILDGSGYQEINTPIVVKDSLFAKSGHLENYSENMYKLDMKDENFYLKPMNCPEAIIVYSSKMRSYRDLPIKLSEIGRLHRNEISGALGGMFRVRQITMDDAHIFCTQDQLQSEITKLFELVNRFYGIFDFKPELHFSTRPDEAMGSVEVWNAAEQALENALKANNMKYIIKPKEGAFYGPKIDIMIKDALNRNWQMATIQVDMQMPERFDLAYEGSDGKKHRPVMVHRAIFGSFERFIGVLTEHYAGNFPFWLAPVQVAMMPITENQIGYAEQVESALKKKNIRVQLDIRSEKIGYKIREAENKKIPYMLIVGDKEKMNNTVSVREHKKGDTGSIGIEEFIKKLEQEFDPLNNLTLN